MDAFQYGACLNDAVSNDVGPNDVGPNDVGPIGACSVGAGGLALRILLMVVDITVAKFREYCSTGIALLFNKIRRAGGFGSACS